MNFSDALKRVKIGDRLFRSGWNGRNMFIYLVEGFDFEVVKPPLLGVYPRGKGIKQLPYLAFVTAQGDTVPWLISQTDVLANDWAILVP